MASDAALNPVSSDNDEPLSSEEKPMSTERLSATEIDEIREAFVNERRLYDAELRSVLLANIDANYVQRLPLLPNPIDQLVADLNQLNASERLENGESPLKRWLENAAAVFSDLRSGVVFKKIFAQVDERTPEVAPAAPSAPPFSSLEQLMAEHTDLLTLSLDHQDTTKARQFIERAVQTGTRLSNTDERRIAQSLLNYWVTVLYRAHDGPPPNAILASYLTPTDVGFQEGQCPYVGLSPFSEADSDSFFGRDSLVNLIVQRLHEKRLVVLVGPSGGGKTSVLNAGVLPRLKNDPESESKDWVYFPSFTPGSEPLSNLATMMSGDVKQTAEKLFRQPEYLREFLNDPNFGGKPCVLVIDQFEELFNFCKDDTKRKAFLDALFSLRESEIKHRVILSMRSDQINHFLRRPDLNDLFLESEMRLYPMKEGELHDVIKKPAEKIGLKFQPGLVEQLLREIYGDPVGLPLLQFVLLELWAQRECDTITWAAMNRLSSCRDALVGKAERLYASLSQEKKDVMRRIFLRMVRLSDTWEAATEPVRFEDLYRVGEDRKRVNAVLGQLLHANLARISNVSCKSLRMASGEEVSCDLPDQIWRDYQFELAHQTLARYWPEAIQWFTKLRESLVIKRRLELYAGNWGILGHGQQGLLDTYQLHEAEDWLETEESKELGYDPDIVPMMDLSRKAIRREKIIRWTSWAAVVVVIFVAVLVIAWSQHRRLTDQTSLRLALQADSLKSKQLDLALLLNLEAMTKNNSDYRVLKGLHKSLLDVLAYSPTLRTFLHVEDNLEGQENNSRQIGFSQDGQTIFTLDESGQIIRPWRVQDHKYLGEITTPAPKSTFEKFPVLSPNGRNLLFITQDWLLVNWNVDTKEQQTLCSLPQEATGIDLPLVAYSNDSKQIAWVKTSESGAREISVLDLGTKKKNYADAETLQNLAFSPDNQTIATINYKGDVVLFAVSDLRQIGMRLTCPSDGLSASTFPIAFSGNGERLLARCSTTKVVIWNLKDQRQLGVFERGVSANSATQARSKGGGVKLAVADDYSTVASLALDSSGQQLVVGYEDGSVILWNVDNGVSTEYARHHNSGVATVLFSKDDMRLLTRSKEGQLLLWNRPKSSFETLFESPQELLTGLQDKVFFNITFSPDSSLIAAAGEAGPVVLWDLQQRLPGNKLTVNNIGMPGALLPNNHVFLMNDNGIVEFDLANNRDLRDFSIRGNSQGSDADDVRDIVFSKGHPIAAIRYFDGRVGVWDLRTGRLLRGIDVADSESLQTSLYQGMTIDSLGTKLAIASKGKIDVWTLADWNSIRIDYNGADSASLTLSADGSKLAASDENGQISIWDTRTGQSVHKPLNAGAQSSILEFTTDSARLLSYNAGSLSLWDLNSGKKMFSAKTRIFDLALNPIRERDELAVTTEDAIVIWSLAQGKEQLILPTALITGNRLHPDRLLYAADGESLVVGYVDGSINWISLDPALLKKRACAVANRSLKGPEAKAYAIDEARWLRLRSPPLDAGCAELR